MISASYPPASEQFKEPPRGREAPPLILEIVMQGETCEEARRALVAHFVAMAWGVSDAGVNVVEELNLDSPESEEAFQRRFVAEQAARIAVEAYVARDPSAADRIGAMLRKLLAPVEDADE
jgi:hypothetical protein